MKIFKITKTQAYSMLGMKKASMTYYSKKAGLLPDEKFMYITDRDLVKVCQKHKWSSERIEQLFITLNNDLSLYDFGNITAVASNMNAFKRLVRLIKYWYDKQLSYNMYRLILKYA